MCGIAGIYNLNGKRKTDSGQLIRRMANSLSHRGPDDEGFFVDRKISLGHRRLSILDLSSLGNQPMRSHDGRFVIVFNGEVYNFIEISKELEEKGHGFKSGSDTEVILAAYEEWGPKALEKFNGMWAMAIYDSKDGSLFCSRDRLGVKPFYYCFDGETFIFASEIKAILEYPGIARKPNDQIIYDYLLHGFTDHTNQTFFKGINQLMPGHYVSIKNNELRINKYWDLEPKNTVDLSDQEAFGKFEEIFTDSVKMRLRSDVSVGSCLSGGIDSSSIVVKINQLLREEGKIESVGTKQKTFSSVYSKKEFQKANERKFIDEVIKETNVDPYFIESDPEKLWEDVKKLIRLQDEPFGSTSIYAQWNVFRLAKETKVKVMLDGQGADEMMAGYLGTFGVYFAELLRRVKLVTLANEYRAFRKNHPEVSPASLVRNIGFALIQSVSGKMLDNIYKKSRPNLHVYDDNFTRRHFHAFRLPGKYKDTLKDYNYWMIKSVSLPSLLHWEDRNSMAHSIESRVPFLDYRLVEYIFSLKDEQLLRRGVSKYCLREAMRGLLPARIYNRQDKVGFATPEEVWFKNYARKEVEEIINSESFKKRPYFNWEKLKKYFDEVMEGKKPFDFTIWRWINLELWLREFIDGAREVE